MRLGKVIHKEIHVMLLFRLAQLLTPRLPDALAVSLLSYSFWLDHRHWDKDNWNYTLQGAGLSLPFVLAFVCY